MPRPSKFKKLTVAETKRYDKYLNDGCETSEEADYAELTSKHNDFINPPELSEGAKTHLIERYSRDRYDTKKAIISSTQRPQQAKGTFLEEEAADLLSKVDGVKYQKSTGTESNDYLMGYCDLLSPKRDRIVEIKTAWSTDSFFPHHNGKLSPSIWYQVQGYLELYNIDYAQVCYVLLNTPPHLIEQDRATTFKRYVYGEITREKYEYLMGKIDIQYDYNRIPMKRRIIRYEIERYKPVMDAVFRKVELSRLFLAEFDKVHSLNKNTIVLPEQYLNVGNSEEDNT